MTATVLGLAGLIGIITGVAFDTDPQPPVGPSGNTAAPLAGTDHPSISTPEINERSNSTLPPARPRAVRIPSIGVEAPVVPLGLNADHTVEVPEDFSRTGWYRHGPTPGEIGSAVILGHVDSHHGPAVFYRLHELRSGDAVRVTRVDGTTATFRVDAVRQYPKNRFPTNRVYGATDHAALRLITCGGDFNTTTRDYESNIIVYAHLSTSNTTG
ncbi:class F sortase [Actinopolyspora mortivallis]|uniref:class F sortase n=1 Tax=Actinopolyspora mortivallis TaxID=33906 RepID=UPI001C62D698|nr:class F sortase [Actinopolyspora mortivallis]